VIRHVYHVYADGPDCSQAMLEHCDALHDSGLLDALAGRVYVGVVGSPDNRAEALEYLHSRGIRVDLVATADEGWEQVTLDWLRNEALRYPTLDCPTLYAHTKGAANVSEINTSWRRSMTYWNVIRWRDTVRHLEEADAVGCHWISDGRFFGGNYWWARNEYLATLPPLDYSSRYMAEVWIGSEHQRPYDVVPGWPAFDRFTTTW